MARVPSGECSALVAATIVLRVSRFFSRVALSRASAREVTIQQAFDVFDERSPDAQYRGT